MTPAPAEKPIVEKGTALAVPASGPEKKAKAFRFAKNLHPDERIPVAGVEFRRGVRKDGMKETFGVFSTPDPEVADRLRKYAESEPTKYIFEITEK